MSWRVAYLTARAVRGIVYEQDVPELERRSRELIFAAGAEQGIRFELRYWDDPALAEAGFDAALIRSCWDYFERADAFLAALEVLEARGVRVFNSSAVARWNARKTYLRELGAAAIETVWLDRADAAGVARAFDALGADELIVKPQIGAGSVETVRLRRGAWSEADLAGAPRGAAMAQAFLRSIQTEGEWSLFWFGGRYSHAVRKLPNAGDWRANIGGETAFMAAVPARAALDAAEAARAQAPRDLLYVRIDLVLGDDGRWRVLEIEAIEPYLFLDFAPEGAAALTGALSRVLAG